MDEESRDTIPESSTVICGHQVCQTREATWLCIENIYQKCHRPNFYDIGGTYLLDIADYWFMFKTEQVGKIFLLHIFACNHQEGSFSIGLSYSNELKFDRKNGSAYLSSLCRNVNFKDVKEKSQNYITTYSFSDLDVELLKDKKLYIAVSFPLSEIEKLNQIIIDFVKGSHNFGALLADPIGSDFTIESADGTQFKVHKVLLAAHSEVFKAMLKEDTAESQNNYVKLVDVGKEDLYCILEFIYTGSVTNLEECNCFNLLELADRYNLQGLRELSQHALSQQLSIDNALEVLIVADMYNSQVLKTEALKFIKRNVSVLQTSTFKEIHNADLMRELCQYLVPSQ